MLAASAATDEVLVVQPDSVMRIGRNHPWARQTFFGTIDDLRVYDRVLTDAEVGLLYRK